MSSTFQNKLLQYEVQPPERIWEELSAALDQEESYSFKDRLFAFVQTPPPSVWSRIIKNLKPIENAVVVVLPFYKRYSRPLKYSGVAIAFVVMAMLSTLLISKKGESETPGNQIVQQNSLPIVPIHSERTHPSDSRDLTQDQGTHARSSISLPEKLTSQLQAGRSNTLGLMDNFAPKYAYRNRTITFSQPTENYMVYSDAKGNAVRLPKKLFDAYACPEETITCRQRFKKLQEKIALSSMTSDLSGMLEMLNNLQENQ